MYLAVRVLFMAGTRYRKPAGPNKAGEPFTLGHILVGPLRRAQRGERTGSHPRVNPEGMLRPNMRYSA
jgi:hypothetical protein